MCTQCHEVLEVSSQKSRSEYTISCIAFALLWPLFLHLFFLLILECLGLIIRLYGGAGVKGALAQ